MGLTNFPNGVSSFGIPLLGSSAGLPVSTGNYYYVDSSTGANQVGLGTRETPFSTIDYAIGQCTANKGDVILVMPGHTETITGAGGITLDIAGVSVIGLGNGALRPTITYTTASTGTFAITAANCLVKNLIFNANYADVATAVIVSGINNRIEGCLFKEQTTDMNFLNCFRTGAVANGADGLEVVDNVRMSIDTAAIAFVSILEATNNLLISGNFDNQAGATDVGHFIIMGAFVCLGARIIGNILNLNGDNNAQTVGVFATGSSTTSTGTMAYNLVNQLDATTELFDTATLDFGHFENYMTGVIAKSGYLLPAADA